jgi:hypothetical protein
MLKLNIRPLNQDKPHDCYLNLEKFAGRKTKKNKIVANGYFANTDMRNGIFGLSKIAAKRKINLDTLQPGELVVFVNRYQTKVKIATGGRHVSYLPLPDNQPLNPGIIAMIPKFYNGQSINYDAALRYILEKEYQK